MIDLRKQIASIVIARRSAPDAGFRLMKWVCMDCSKAKRPAKFFVQINLYPAAGCLYCGSRQIIDCNVEPIKVKGMADAPWLKPKPV